MKNQNIEVEGGELLIQSEEGHYAIIPKKHRKEVEDMIAGKCDGCINDYIQHLPKNNNYAEDGTLLPETNNPTFGDEPYASKRPLSPLAQRVLGDNTNINLRSPEFDTQLSQVQSALKEQLLASPLDAQGEEDLLNAGKPKTQPDYHMPIIFSYSKI